VIENDPTDDPRELGEWLTQAGIELDVLRPYAGAALPEDLTGYDALVVLGGGQQAYAEPGEPWFGTVRSLLRKAVRFDVPTLGICLGAQLLAQAHGGTVAPAAAGPEIGARLVAKRDAAERDPLFRPLPLLPDVVQWHHDEVTELPAGAVLLAASTHYPHQAFRIGGSAWGLQFHIECDAAMVARWAANDRAVLDQLGTTPEEVVASVEQVLDDIFEVWHPFAVRFAALVRGELPRPDPVAPAPAPGRELPLFGG